MRISVEGKLQELGYNISAIEEATVESFRVAVGDLSKRAQQEWIRIAQARLKTSRADYINGLRQAESYSMRMEGGVQIFEVQLVGRMPNAFEFGMDSFDMIASRPGWLGGSKAKTSKDGTKYIHIPFRHSIQQAAGLAYTGKAKRADVANELKKTAKKYGLDRMIHLASGKVPEGPVKRVPKGGATHPYLEGLTRIQKAQSGTYKSGKQRGSGMLMTWRTMSEKSDGWNHPGLTGRNILKDVSAWVDGELDKVINIIMERT
jgi:hypothetical protein